jgi:hypothetical protein
MPEIEGGGVRKSKSGGGFVKRNSLQRVPNDMFRDRLAIMRVSRTRMRGEHKRSAATLAFVTLFAAFYTVPHELSTAAVRA